jgi:hypothetical protein
MKTQAIIIAIACALVAGCTINRPHMREKTTSTSTNGVTSATERELQVTSLTVWPAKESIAGQKASLGKTMSTGVESLSQEGGGTNVTETLRLVIELLKIAKP